MQCEEWDDANSELFKESHDEAVHKNSYKNRLYELISASLELCVFRRPRNRASSISVMTASIIAVVSVPVALVETVLMASIVVMVSVFVVLVETALAASIVVMVSVSVILVKTAFMTAFIGMVIILIAALEGGAAVPEIFTSYAVLHFIGRGGGFFRPEFFLHGLMDDRAIGTVRID